MYRILKHWPTLLCASAVFVIAILVRLPSCYESFWVDELHTTWCIWGDWEQVSPRAAAGNQTPLYFHLMRIWKLIAGESEVGLRMSSILAVAIASAVTVVGLANVTKNLPAAMFGGAILALESNSIFFGTEFRPYAFVVLFTSVATWAGSSMLQSESEQGNGMKRFVFVSAGVLAVLMQPTSLVAFAIFAGTLLVASFARIGVWPRVQIIDLVSLILITAVAFSLADSSLSNSWRHRDMWRAFGHASDVNQFWEIWDWVPLAIIPLYCGILACVEHSERCTWRRLLQGSVPLWVGVVTTVVFFVCAMVDWVPLWHRRYFVAALPLMAWSAGELMAHFGFVLGSRRASVSLSAVAGCALLGILLGHQGTLNVWWSGRTQLVFRGEDWRGAIRWVNEQSKEGSNHFSIDSGLIEAQVIWGGISMTRDPVRDEYLCYPASSVYRIPKIKRYRGRDSVSRWKNYRHLENDLQPGDTPLVYWLISRKPQAELGLDCERQSIAQFSKPTYRRFGRVWVVRMKGANSRQMQEMKLDGDERERIRQLQMTKARELHRKRSIERFIQSLPEKDREDVREQIESDERRFEQLRSLRGSFRPKIEPTRPSPVR